MKVKLIKRKLPSGNITLMLEYYGEGGRTFESLGMVLTKKNKEQHSNYIAKAKEISIKKQAEYLSHRHDHDFHDRGRGDFIAFFKSLVPDGSKSNKLNTLPYFIKFKPGCLFRDVNKRLVSDFAQYMKDSAPTLNDLTKSIYMRAFITVVNDAVGAGHVSGNPTQGFKMKKFFNPLQTDRPFFTKSEIAKLAATPCKVEVIKRAFLFSCYTGLRHSDVRSLKWENITHSEELGTYLQIRMDKTKKLIKIKLYEKDVLLLGKDESRQPFFGLKGSSDKQNIIMQMWFVQSGVNYDGHTYHSSRHSYAVNSLLAGVDIFTLRGRMGHSSVVTTEIYAKIVESLTSEAADKLNDYYND